MSRSSRSPSCRSILPSLLLLTLPWVAGAQASAPTRPVVEISVQPLEARPGDPVAIRVRGGVERPTGTLGETPLTFFPFQDGHLALAALPMETPPGVVPIAVRPARRTPPLAAELKVLPPEWRTRTLTVSKAFTEKRSAALRARIRADQKAFQRALSQKPVAPRFAGSFALPREATFTAFFGDRRTFNGELKSQHYGLDLDGAVGAPIHAANDGLVVLVRDCFASGNSVIVDHGAGLFTLYFHLSAIDVAEGQQVRKGELLGKVGSTGRVTGPHLHWSVKVDGRYVDPRTLIQLDLG